jgi:hypothetical protein
LRSPQGEETLSELGEFSPQRNIFSQENQRKDNQSFTAGKATFKLKKLTTQTDFFKGKKAFPNLSQSVITSKNQSISSKHQKNRSSA